MRPSPSPTSPQVRRTLQCDAPFLLPNTPQPHFGVYTVAPLSRILPHMLHPTEPHAYQIRLKGHLGPQWADWFGGLTISLEENGDTLLTGPIPDQAALHGLFKKIRDLGLPLLAVVPLEIEGN